MAFLREYDYREASGVLVKYFYLDSQYRKPSLVIRMNVFTKSFRVEVLGYSVTPTIICEEVYKLYDLLEQPHWKSFVKTCGIFHRYWQDGLFDS